MVKRLISAAVGVVILLVVLFSNNIYLLAAGVSVITLMALYELYQATGLWKFKLLVVFGGIFCIFLIFFQFSGLSSFFGGMLIYMVALFLLLILGYKNIRFEEICIAFVLSLILPIFFLQIVKVRLLVHGKYLIYLVFIASFITDAMAFFVGRSIGKHKFAPKISPNKTLEGAIGGVVGGVLGFLVFGLCMQYIFELTPNYLLLGVFGLLGAVIAEIGDLSASAIKREFSLKDYGDIMPGHGGVMDRFDSVLFVAPLLYLLLNNFTVLW